LDLGRKESTSSFSNPLLAEIRKGVALKKISQPAKEEEKRPMKINKVEGNFLQITLQQAIKNRREQITKNDVASDSEDSDWSS
jgi:hypothetical protein